MESLPMNNKKVNNEFYSKKEDFNIMNKEL